MPATSPEAIKRKREAAKAKREAAKAAAAEPQVPAVPDETDDGEVTGGFPSSSGSVASSSEDSLPAAKFKDVNLEPVTPKFVPPVSPSPDIASPCDPYREWLRSPQGRQISHLGGVNMARLHFVYQDRVEAIFRAGFAAGVDEGI